MKFSWNVHELDELGFKIHDFSGIEGSYERICDVPPNRFGDLSLCPSSCSKGIAKHGKLTLAHNMLQRLVMTELRIFAAKNPQICWINSLSRSKSNLLQFKPFKPSKIYSNHPNHSKIRTSPVQAIQKSSKPFSFRALGACLATLIRLALRLNSRQLHHCHLEQDELRISPPKSGSLPTCFWKMVVS